MKVIIVGGVAGGAGAAARLRRLEESAERYSGETVKIVAHPGRSAAGFRRNGRHVLLAIGPEGGFVKSEVEALAAAGFVPMGFGSHILRVEFAAAYIAGFLMGCR